MKRHFEPPQEEHWLPGFQRYYAEHVEHKIRLPKHTGRASARAIWTTYAAILATTITAVAWFLNAPSQAIGLMSVLSGALMVGAVQLRMAGSSPGAAETRNLIVGLMAEFNQFEYQLGPPMEDVNAVVEGAGAISGTAITRGADALRWEGNDAGQVPGQSVLLLGGPGPSAAAGRWFGIDVEDIWPQYSCDGLLVRLDFDSPFPEPVTITCDPRLHSPPDAVTKLPLVACETGSEAFDEVFFVLNQMSVEATRLLTPKLREWLLYIKGRAGSVTLYTVGTRAYATVWFVGDLYEVTSLGFGLRRQAHQIAESMRWPLDLAAALQDAAASDGGTGA